MTRYFVDTSALVKRYHREPGSHAIDALFAEPGVTFCMHCSPMGAPWRLAAVDEKGIATTFDISEPGGGRLKLKRLKMEILTDRGLATFLLDLEAAVPRAN